MGDWAADVCHLRCQRLCIFGEVKSDELDARVFDQSLERRARSYYDTAPFFVGRVSCKMLDDCGPSDAIATGDESHFGRCDGTHREARLVSEWA